MYAELSQDAQTIAEIQLCRYFRRAMPPNWQDKLAFCGISYETITELAMYFERLERCERQNGRECQNGQGKNGERGQGRRDQQRPFNDRRDRRNQRGHHDSHENRPHRRTVTDNKKHNDRHDDTGMWCKFHKQSLKTPASASPSRSSARSTSQLRYRQQSRARTSIPYLKRGQVTVTATTAVR